MDTLKKQTRRYWGLLIPLGIAVLFGFMHFMPTAKLKVTNNGHISLIGGNLGSRMTNYDHFETDLQLRFPSSNLTVRNLCDGGNTAGFRPNPNRNDPWAFPGAEKFQTEFANNSHSEGHMESQDEWLTRLKTDIVIGFFGFSESFAGPAGVANFKAELDAFVKHTLAQKYNGQAAPQLALVSPVAFENLSAKMDVPDGKKENVNIALYVAAMKEVAAKNKVLFVDAYHPSLKWYAASKNDLTIDGSQLNDEGYRKLSQLLNDELFGKAQASGPGDREAVYNAVMEKNWMWLNDYKIPNGVHVYGRRYNPFGQDNYPAEIEKTRQLTEIRDRAIWAAAEGKSLDVAALDKGTRSLPEVKTNYNPEKNGSLKYLYGEEAISHLKLPEGYKIELFASEKEFPDLANPMQLSFDNKGRLWVAVMPTYPHYRPGDAKPNDKILIFEDTDNDGKADKQTIFADHLHLPVGFEIESDGVYVSQGTNFVKLTDTDGDSKADKREILLSGFDDHDTHHNIHAFCADPSGAIYMGEGVFLHTNVETSYGTVRATNGGFYRYNPKRRQLERTAQLSIPNPWGIAFDDWGQPFFAETSGPDVRWMLPGTVLPRYGEATHKSVNLIEDAHRVRPTSGLEFVSSRHFPDNVQGDLLINNTIGFLGTKQHVIEDDGTGYKSRFRQDLLVSTDRNFRPVDMEFAPDGSLYVVDWHNVLIGHMQHNARDPLRDHMHGRVYRITYPSRPLVTPAKIDGAGIDELLENLKLPEYRTRYRTKRELRGRAAGEVLPRLTAWVNALDKADPRYEHHKTEALWVSWGLNKIDQKLLRELLNARDYKVRAAAVRAVRYNTHQVADYAALLKKAAADENGRVRLEAIVAASWLPKAAGMTVLNEAKKHPLDNWMVNAYETSVAHLNGQSVKEKKQEEHIKTNLKGDALALYTEGKAIYAREGFCTTCHQENGKGLTASGFPPLSGTSWVTGSETRLIKLVLNGLLGPIQVSGKDYPGQVPMTPFKGMLNDREVAAVLTYVRNSFDNVASPVKPEQVKKVRAEISNFDGFYSPDALLKEHPLEDK
ncbi:GDSL-type esterase/lipase family protein [Ravibacter arvi]|uniref:GDSL-type esterase/lipase family protein n=1 Tax=Ravibacter arvi TaxID=2051041 RepID=A0ABP8LLZ2_9BACT